MDRCSVLSTIQPLPLPVSDHNPMSVAAGLVIASHPVTLVGRAMPLPWVVTHGPPTSLAAI